MHIFTLLPLNPGELCRLRLVSRTINELVQRNYVWHMLALEQWLIVDVQQRPRKGESWRSYYIETHKMLRLSEETFLRAAVERGLLRVVRDHLARFLPNVVEHLCCAIQHSQPTLVLELLPHVPSSQLGGAARNSPLRRAIRANQVDLVRRLLALGADARSPPQVFRHVYNNLSE